MQMFTFTMIIFFLLSCSNVENTQLVGGKYEIAEPELVTNNRKNAPGSIEAIPLPEGYERVKSEKNSFGTWLRAITLKKDKTVYLYNGTKKRNQSAQFAVLNISVPKVDLQQCADAVMRLRAEYFFDQKAYDKILFTDNEAGRYAFTAPYTRQHFDRYLLRVFGMCGTASLAKQMKPQQFNSIKQGDVIIKGGFPGHAVLVMDVAKNKTGKKIYLLAQSYMPAQDIHVLINEQETSLSPWYLVNDETHIYTPEYTFLRSQLKTW